MATLVKKFFRMFFNQRSSIIYVVSGLPRSGTSLVMHMLEAGGITPLTDGMRVADKDNPKGYYEYEPVKKLPEGHNQWLKQARGKVVKIIAAHLAHLPENYCFKVILIRRDINEVMASQKKMLVHRGELTDEATDRKLSILFAKHTEQTITWLNSAQHYIDHIIIDYNQLMYDPTPVIQKIDCFLNIKLDVQAMRQVIDPALYRNRR